MAAVGEVAAAISLIRKVIKAATDAKMMKKEFKELASYLELIGSQLEMLDERVLGDASMQTFRKIDEVLLQCHDLANSCQQRNSFYLMINGGQIQSQLRGAREKISQYFALIPLIHFTQVFRRFKEEDTKINEYWHEHANDESDIPERIDNFTGNEFQSDAHLFTYEQIVKMTHNFERVIGKGGFGTVYYGFLEYGIDVAVKLQNQSSQQSDMEFFAELRSLTRVHHANLISLIGYCKDKRYLAIVYEYMPGGSLDAYLRGKTGVPVLTWAQRLQIAYQAAQGLDYLHTECNPPIIHRDVKSSNILLGSDLEAKITDFGISKACNDTNETTVVGTFGYLDPEYFQTGHVSKASDVYSFGIILLEMITGQPATIRGEEQHIVEWISYRITSGADFVDRSMNEYYDPSFVQEVLQLALSCTDSSASRRPLMAEVAIKLKGIIEMQPFEQITTEDMNSEEMENEEVEEAFVTSIAQADRPLCRHRLSAILFTSWAHDAPGRRFWRCKNWKKVGDCGYFKWHDPVQDGVMTEQMDYVNNQRDELDEEIKMMDEESAFHFSKWKALEEKIAECERTKGALEMKSKKMSLEFSLRKITWNRHINGPFRMFLPMKEVNQKSNCASAEKRVCR